MTIPFPPLPTRAKACAVLAAAALAVLLMGGATGAAGVGGHAGGFGGSGRVGAAHPGGGHFGNDQMGRAPFRGSPHADRFARDQFRHFDHRGRGTLVIPYYYPYGPWVPYDGFYDYEPYPYDAYCDPYSPAYDPAEC